jgi:aryl-alcohol dehydrogenase-like predicted oxidoreductase
MQYRKFGNTELQVSEIGFGAWAIGGGAMVGNTAIGWGNVDDAVSTKAIFAAVDAGINFFDTADIYGLGHSEKIIGNAIGKNREMIIATKVGNVARNEIFTFDYTKEYIVKACEESLQRLQRDCIDYYQLHTARMQHLQNGECIEAMEQLQKAGKIKYWGISLNTFDPEPEANFFIENKIGYGFQLVLNVLNQKALSLMKTAAALGYGIIARMPLQFGLLTGKFDNGFKFSENDHRKGRLTENIINETNRALEPLWQLCTKYNCTKTTLALSFILHYNQITTIIPGIRNVEQVNSNTMPIIQFDMVDIMMLEKLGENECNAVMELIKLQG